MTLCYYCKYLNWSKTKGKQAHKLVLNLSNKDKANYFD